VAELIERCCRHASRFADALQGAGYHVLNDVVLNQVVVSFGDADLERDYLLAKALQVFVRADRGGTVDLSGAVELTHLRHELQFEGSGSDTAISSGADGTQGIDPPLVDGNDRTPNIRQNPTAHKDYYGYGTSESYGYRLLNLNRWESALFGRINLETLAIIRHDVKGTTPGIATNFTHGRKQFNFGLRGDYLSTYIAEIRYTWFTGGGKRDGQRDRDNVFVTVGYQF